MQSERQRLASMTLDQVADALADAPPESPRATAAIAEFMRRQTVAQREAADAQICAASAAEATAQHTRDNARYLLWSVIVLVVSSLATLGVSVANLIVTMGGGKG